MSLTIINSDQSWQIQKWIHDNISEPYVKFDNFNINLIQERLYCMNLFSNSENILIYDNDVVNNVNNLKKYSDYLNMMKTNENHFYLITDSLTTKITKKDFNIISFESISFKNKTQIIKNICREFKICIDDLLLEYLGVKLPLDYGPIYYEIQKLSFFRRPITKKDIDDYICDYSSETTFNILENLIIGNTKELLTIYQNLIDQKKDVFLIINSLMTQTINAYAIKSCLIKRQSSKTITNNLGMNFFVVNKLTNLLYNLNIDNLREIIHNLAMLDVKIKRNNLNKELFLKLWLINESRKYGK